MATVTDGLLDGLRVVDFSMNLSGPYASMLLADLGADVVKIEPMTGDPHRTLLPMKAGMGLLFASVNRNKRSIVIDLKTSEGRDVALSLIDQADVLFNNFRPGVLERLAMTYDIASARNPGLVYCSLSGYGASGPRATSPAYDLAIQALAGGMSITGYPDGPPARAGIPIADLCGGAYSVIAILAALTRRGITGKGGEVETSLFDSQISMLMYWAAIALNTDGMPAPQGGGNSTITPYGPYQASDGYVIVAVYGAQFWPKICNAVGRPDLIDDPRFSSNPARIENRSLLETILSKEFSQKTVAQWITVLEKHDVPCSPVNNVKEAMLEPQTLHRDLLVELEIGGEMLSFAGNPIKEVPAVPRASTPPPAHGQHTSEILTEWLGYQESDLKPLFDKGVLLESTHYRPFGK